MKTRRLILTFIIIFVQLVSIVSPVYTAPPLPSSFYGTVKVGGANVPIGTPVTAWINGVQYASYPASIYLGDTVYSLNVPGDNSETPGVIEGGVEGNTIVFHIGALVADQTAIWHSGPNINLNLTAPVASSAKAITAYSFTSPAATGVIDEGAHTITVPVPHGTNVTALVATFTTTGASVKVGTTDQVSGTTPNDFTNPVTYTVTAADS